MSKVFWSVLLFAALGCGGPEGYGYVAVACDGCDWVLPPGSVVNAQQLVSDGQQLYWIQSYTQQLLRVQVGGGDVEQVSSWLERSFGLLHDATAIYSREADPPQEFAARLVRVDKLSGEQTLLSEGNVASTPALLGSELLYFEQTPVGWRLIRQQTSTLARKVVLDVSGSHSPSTPVVFGSSVGWCAYVDSAVSVFRSPLGASVSEAAYALPGEIMCPELFERDGELFGFSEREAGRLLELAEGGATTLKTGITGDESFRSWGLTSLIDGSLLLTQLGGSELRIVDSAGAPIWAGKVRFGIQLSAVANDDDFYVAGARALAGFPLPGRVKP